MSLNNRREVQLTAYTSNLYEDSLSSCNSNVIAVQGGNTLYSTDNRVCRTFPHYSCNAYNGIAPGPTKKKSMECYLIGMIYETSINLIGSRSFVSYEYFADSNCMSHSGICKNFLWFIPFNLIENSRTAS